MGIPYFVYGSCLYLGLDVVMIDLGGSGNGMVYYICVFYTIELVIE